MFKIIKLRIHNFKIFKDLELNFSDSSAIILSGRNGFGKTSIFDALELLFTGKIVRYETYVNNLHDNNFNLHSKQFVHDENEATVFIEATLQVDDGEEQKIRIEGKTEDLNFPIKDFTKVFHREGPDIFKNYTRINYISQDETTEYLKRKETDREKQISRLFRTESFDKQIQQIEKAKEAIYSLKREYNERISNAEEALKRLQTSKQSALNVNPNVSNISLFEDSNIAWDSEKPNISVEEIEDLVKENGTLSNIEYYIRNKEDYKAHTQNEILKLALMGGNLNHLSIYLEYHSKENIIKQFLDYRNNYLNYFENIDVTTICHQNLQFVESLKEIVSLESFQVLEDQRKNACKLLSSASQLELACNQLLESRKAIRRSLESTNFNKCPICGTEFDSKTDLISHIDNYQSEISRTLSSLANNKANIVLDFKNYFERNVINKLKEYFSHNQIDQDVAVSYTALKDSLPNEEYFKVAKQYIDEDKILDNTISKEDLQIYIKNILEAKLQKEEPNINWELLQTVNRRYGRLLRKDITVKDIAAKRDYLLSYLLQLSTKQFEENTNIKKKAERLTQKCEDCLNQYSKLLDQIKTAKNDYLTQVVGDIEILFYIYSGRIMQDCYYGRGVFLYRDVTRNNVSRIIFRTGSYSTGVDILYNLSSGQMISVAIAFLMALNKLYDDIGFLAIDDPVQTIDDINFWGFIETVRHEFDDNLLLFSTHEDRYSALLRYKLSMMGKKAKTIDMLDIHKKDAAKSRGIN